MTLNDTTPPLRTIRRVSLPLNQGKWEALRKMARCYRGEKNEHLRHYNQDARFAAADSERAHRDQLVQAGYVSPHELQARMWKMALKDGYETVARQWAALSTALQPDCPTQAMERNRQTLRFLADLHPPPHGTIGERVCSPAEEIRPHLR